MTLAAEGGRLVKVATGLVEAANEGDGRHGPRRCEPSANRRFAVFIEFLLKAKF